MEIVRLGQCLTWKVSNLESVRLAMCPTWKVNDLEIFPTKECVRPEGNLIREVAYTDNARNSRRELMSYMRSVPNLTLPTIFKLTYNFVDSLRSLFHFPGW